MISTGPCRWLAIAYTVFSGTTSSLSPTPIRAGHETMSAKLRSRKTNPVEHSPGDAGLAQLPCDLDGLCVIANCAAQHGGFRRLDSREDVSPFRNVGRRRPGPPKSANIDADHVVSAASPYPL